MNSQPRTKEVAPADGTCKNPVPRDPVAIEQSHCHSYPPTRASDGANVGTLEMDVWGALQYVGTGLSLVAFAVAAIFYAYRARLTNRAEIIKSAPEKQRLGAIAVTAEFSRVDVSGLTRAQQQDIALTQIRVRARRDLLLASVSLTVAVLLAAIAIVAILASKSTGHAIVVNPSGPVIAAGRDITGAVTIGLDEEKVGERVLQAQKPLDAKLEEILAMTAREKGLEVAPLHSILIRMGEVGVRDEDIAKRLDEKANELIKLRADIAKSKQGPPVLASFAQQADALIKNGDLDGGREALTAGRTAARTMREESSGYEANFLAQEATVDHLQLAYGAAAAKYAEAAGVMAVLDPQKHWEFVLAQANELNSQGDEFGDNSALRSAIEQYKALLDVRSQARVSLDWAKIQTSLGNAYRMLGERQ